MSKVRQAQSIDYTRTGWGHNLSIKQDDDGLLRGFVWYRFGVRVGDEMTWKAAHGTTTGRVTECRPCLDPDDMFEVAVEVVRRDGPTGEQLWP